MLSTDAGSEALVTGDIQTGMPLPSEALKDLWNVEDALEKTALGVSRATWRVEGGFWLTRCPEDRGDAFRREGELIQSIGEVVKAHSELGLITPALIPTVSGRAIGSHCRCLWRLTRHIEGFHPQPNDPNTYGLMADVLLRLHNALEMISDRDIRHPIFLESLRDYLSLAAENATLARAAAWLLPRQDRLRALPMQLVHGDWTPLNVLLGGDGSAGVLDFEACARGPAVLDFANICSTMLMWSGFSNAAERINGLVPAFQERAKAPVDLNLIQIGMLAHWFVQYREWRSRPLTAENAEVVRRLLGRIETVLEFVGG